jgi:hypothetical protein
VEHVLIVTELREKLGREPIEGWRAANEHKGVGAGLWKNLFDNLTRQSPLATSPAKQREANLGMQVCEHADE